MRSCDCHRDKRSSAPVEDLNDIYLRLKKKVFKTNACRGFMNFFRLKLTQVIRTVRINRLTECLAIYLFKKIHEMLYVMGLIIRFVKDIG
jgi:hypothetical protein